MTYATASKPRRALGSVYQRKSDARWCASVRLPDGKRIVRYAEPNSRVGAEQLVASLITQVGAGEVTAPSELTVRIWLDQYLARANRNRAAATIKDRGYSARYVSDKLGHIRLDRLTPQQVQRWADTCPQSHRSKLKALQLLRSALNQAVALGHVARNAALPIQLERLPATVKGVAWTPTEARAFLVANEGTHLALMWHLALQTGARIGELLALRTDDYDPQAATLRIERTLKYGAGPNPRATVGPPKTPRAIRSFRLPPDAAETLRAALKRAAELKASAGSHWQDGGWLFPSEVGTLIPHANAHRAWREALNRLQAQLTRDWQASGEIGAAPVLRRTRPHDLRHTFISLALRRGVKPEVVARMVGHSSALITLRIYRHTYEDELEDAAERVANLV